jgi:hypothetical protein
MMTQRRARIVPDRGRRSVPPCVVAPAIPVREDRRPPERTGFTLVYGRTSGWYYRREREP